MQESTASTSEETSQLKRSLASKAESSKSAKEKLKTNETFPVQATESTLANNISDQPIIPISFPFPSMAPMPEPQMQPYNLLLRFGKVSECHRCGSLFDKTNEKPYVFRRKEEDCRPKAKKDSAVKQWCLGKRTFYYCTQFSYLLTHRPLLKKENKQY